MEPAELDEQETVLVWRADHLQRAGVQPDRALQLAGEPIDVHEFTDAFTELVGRGCSTELAERILQP
jgi:hypothetical protein